MIGHRSLQPSFTRDPDWYNVGHVASERPLTLSVREFLEQLKRQAQGVDSDAERHVLSWYPAMEVEAGRNMKAPEPKLLRFAQQAALIIGCPVSDIYNRFGDGPSSVDPS